MIPDLLLSHQQHLPIGKLLQLLKVIKRKGHWKTGMLHWKKEALGMIQWKKEFHGIVGKPRKIPRKAMDGNPRALPVGKLRLPTGNQ